MRSIKWGGTTIAKNALEDITWNKTFLCYTYIILHVYRYIHTQVGCTPTRVTVLTVFLTLVTSKKICDGLRGGKELCELKGKGGQHGWSERWGRVAGNEVGSGCNFPTLNLQPAPHIWTATSILTTVHHQETRGDKGLSASVSLCNPSLGQVSSYTNVAVKFSKQRMYFMARVLSLR